ncbi:ATP-binding protein [Paenibacillus elgii]|uniref:HAMP domain-containing sensor histidine kinase n=1 Tax=Paenibacillus elgii TaxID=189691 RepID=UPI000248D863
MDVLNRTNNIFNSLIKNYVFFSLTVGIIVSVLYPFFYAQVKEELVDPIVPQLKASEIVRQDDHDIPSKTVESFGGWIKTLDENLRVIDIKGMDTDRQNKYTEQQLLRMFYDRKESADYYSLAPFQTPEGKTYYRLIYAPERNVTKEIRINKTVDFQIKTIARLVAEILIVFLLLFAVNVYLYSRWTARKITNPLEVIASGIKNMAAGRYQTRLSFKADYELAQIQETFNFMAEKLDQAEREKQTMEENRRRMLVGISHDLKTPVTTIQGYAQALQSGLVKTEEHQQKYLTYILNKANFVTSLIDDVFELSKLESPDYRVHAELADLSELVREIAASCYDIFIEKGVFLDLCIPEREMMLRFDKKLMYRAISNILLNALKHNPSGTDVWLQAEAVEAYVYVHIIDNGTGIPEDLKETIFQPFTRGDHARRSDGGTGLGLAIAKQIVEKHGGELLLDTSHRKTAFRVKLK